MISEVGTRFLSLKNALIHAENVLQRPDRCDSLPRDKIAAMQRFPQ